jgi:uncharacterized protein YbjQ (UPF0145 family)
MNVSVNINMVTTAFELPGYRVVKNLGLVRGVTVRSRSIFGTIGASLETLVGGNITLFEEMCEKTREEALELMMQHAIERGAKRSDRGAIRRDRSDAGRDGSAGVRVGCAGAACVR